MSHKLVLIFLIIAAALALAAVAVTYFLVLPAFVNFEKEQSLASLNRVETVLHAQLDTLTGASLEYSAWDDIYEHVQSPGEAPDYFDFLIEGDYWSDINIEIMMFLDREGRLVWGRMIDPEQSTDLLLQEHVPQQPEPDHPLLAHASTDSRIKGFINTPRGILMMGSTPILRSDRTGPIMGTVVIGRLLTAERIADIEQAVSVDVSAHLIPDAGLSDAARLDYESLVSSGVPIATERGETHTFSRKVVRDLYGAPLMLVETRLPNQISTIGSNSVNTALGFLLVVILLFTFSGWWILRRLVLSPLLVLGDHIASVRESGDLSVRFGSDRKDELGHLATEFDALTQELSETQRQRDDAESLSRAKSQFLMSISHEIRTPMNGVIGMTDALLRMDLPENSLRLLSQVKSSGRILLNIIDDILDFSTVSAGQAIVEKERFSLRQMVSDVNSAVADSAQRKGVEYLCRFDSSLPESALGDQQKIKQVLINLIGNAIKFTHAGEVALAVSSEVETVQGRDGVTVLNFTVSDTGIGIPAPSLSAIFESFSQVDNGPGREYGGTGLGLSISKALVEAMGGEIQVSSEYGVGSTFQFTVPVSETIAAVDDGERASVCAGLRALIVDGYPGTRDLVASLLAELGAVADTVASTAEAIVALEAASHEGRQYDLLLVDNQQSNPDSAAFTAALPDGSLAAGAAVILLCNVTDECQVETQVGRIDACLPKPILRDDLLDAIITGRNSDGAAAKPGENRAGQRPQLLIDVLVAEDNEVNQELITFELSEIGARYVLVSNGTEALNELAKGAFDIILMDCHMPGMDGFAATKRIRAMKITDKRGSPVPIVAMTASAGEDDQKHCIAVGMDAYISKPYEFENLLGTISRLLPDTGQFDSVLDAAPLASIRELSSDRVDVLGRLIDVYLESSPPLVSQIGEAIAAGDAEAVRMGAHKLKSSSATLGASMVASLARDLEYLGRDNQIEECANVFSSLARAIEAAYSALEKEKSRSATPA